MVISHKLLLPSSVFLQPKLPVCFHFNKVEGENFRLSTRDILLERDCTYFIPDRKKKAKKYAKRKNLVDRHWLFQRFVSLKTKTFDAFWYWVESHTRALKRQRLTFWQQFNSRRLYWLHLIFILGFEEFARFFFQEEDLFRFLHLHQGILYTATHIIHLVRLNFSRH